MSTITWNAFKVVGATFTALNNVQTVNITSGRRNVQDPFVTAVCTVTGRNPSTLPSLVIGDVIAVKATDSSAVDRYQFVGKVADFSYSYGITSNLDQWTLLVEDSLANAGRINTNTSWLAGDTTWQAAQKVCASAGITINAPIATKPGSSFVSAQTITNGNALSLLQQLVSTEQGRIYGIDADAINWLGRAEITNPNIIAEFNDGTLTGTAFVEQLKYNEIDFLSLANNFATKVVVTPEGLTPQTSGGGARSFDLSSYDQTTSQATNLAAFVKSTLDQSKDVPYVMSCNLAQQTAYAAFSVATAASIGSFINVVLRGVRYRCAVNGFTLAADPSDTRFYYNLIAANVYQFLVLNNVIFGKLNENKLGY